MRFVIYTRGLYIWISRPNHLSLSLSLWMLENIYPVNQTILITTTRLAVSARAANVLSTLQAKQLGKHSEVAAGPSGIYHNNIFLQQLHALLCLPLSALPLPGLHLLFSRS